MLTISDLYREDIEGDAILVVTNPTSALKNKGDKRIFFNMKWLIDDEIKPLNADTNCYSIENYIIIGDRMKIVGPEAPDNFVKHWERSLNQPIMLRYGNLNEEIPHVVRFPLDEIRYDLNVVDPKVHWKVISKEFIQEIDCPQADVLNRSHLKYPCFVKLCRSSQGKGVWHVRNEKQFHTLIDFLKKNIPRAGIVITETIKNVVTTFNAIFYFSKKGEFRWIGATRNIFNEHGLFLGGSVDSHEQHELEMLLVPVMNSVAVALLREGYFGLANVDVVLDNKGDVFVVDINPRFGATTKLMLVSLHLRSQGYGHGIIYSDIKFKMSVTNVISFAEEIKEGKVIILRAIPEKSGETTIANCTLLVFGENSEACAKVLQIINTIAVEPNIEVAQGGQSI